SFVTATFQSVATCATSMPSPKLPIHRRPCASSTFSPPGASLPQAVPSVHSTLLPMATEMSFVPFSPASTSFTVSPTESFEKNSSAGGRPGRQSLAGKRVLRVCDGERLAREVEFRRAAGPRDRGTGGWQAKLVKNLPDRAALGDEREHLHLPAAALAPQ